MLAITDPTFKSIPVDPDTVFKKREQIVIGQLECIHEVWYWEGIDGETLIFKTKDVQAWSEQQLMELVRTYPGYTLYSGYTMKRGEIFTFVNYNFENKL